MARKWITFLHVSWLVWLHLFFLPARVFLFMLCQSALTELAGCLLAILPSVSIFSFVVSTISTPLFPDFLTCHSRIFERFKKHVPFPFYNFVLPVRWSSCLNLHCCCSETFQGTTSANWTYKDWVSTTPSKAHCGPRNRLLLFWIFNGSSLPGLVHRSLTFL